MSFILPVVSEALFPTSRAKEDKQKKPIARTHYLQYFLVVWEQADGGKGEWKNGKARVAVTSPNKYLETQGTAVQDGLKSHLGDSRIFLQCIPDAQRNCAAASTEQVPDHNPRN